VELNNNQCYFYQAEDGIRALVRARGLGHVYKSQYLYYGKNHNDRPKK